MGQIHHDVWQRLVPSCYQEGSFQLEAGIHFSVCLSGVISRGRCMGTAFPLLKCLRTHRKWSKRSIFRPQMHQIAGFCA